VKLRGLGAGAPAVPPVGYGGMHLSLLERPPEAVSLEVIHAALDAGVRLIDTADVYCLDDSDLGHNERLVASALRGWHGPRDDVLVATKGGLRRPAGRWERDGRPEHLRAACEGSLRDLRVDRIDLYQLHAPDSRVPIEDSVGELAKLQQEGKIRHIGVSNFSVRELERVAGIAKIVSVQNRYNIADRRSDDVIAYCEQHGMAFIPWYPLSAGEHAESSATRELARIAKQHNLTGAQAALAWLLARSPAMLPIPGTSSVAHLEENVAAAAATLA
jgi:aryl-alcohol dehydrogenase-like predicted oxidoreductase